MLQAYKNDPKLKIDFLREIEKHRKADQIEQGTYGKENGKWKGCAVACSLRSLAILEGDELHTEYDQHKEYETKLGIPEWLAQLEDTIFERLPKADAKKWPGQFAEAINVGANLEPVKWKFSVYLMKENIDRVLSLDISEELKKQVVDAIRGVLSLNETAIETGIWDESVRSAESAESAAWSAAWSAVRSAESAARSARSAWSAESAAESAAWSVRSAWSAAESAAESAAWSAVESAVESAAWSAAWSAVESAAESAAESAWSAVESVWSAAWSAAYQKHAKELLRLMKECV